MSALASKEPLRPSGDFGNWLAGLMLGAAPTGFALLRAVAPILKLGSTIVVTRYDDVIEAFGSDASFDTPYRENIEILTGGEPFFLGLREGPEYREALGAMRSVFKAEDLQAIGNRAEALADAIVQEASGELEVVGDLVRKVTFDLYKDYIGIPDNEYGNVDVWSTRLFEFQFASSAKDKALRAEVDAIAPAFRDHIDQAIANRKSSSAEIDDVLGRCLARQSSGDALFTDLFIRTNLLCMIVGGPPQVPMVVPHALEQLLRRPEALAAAKRAAVEDNDELLWGYVQEAMRFDPLAPGLPRIALENRTLAKGTRRETLVPAGANLIIGFSSAMRDPRRIAAPAAFDPLRHTHEYIHFGHGLHECFGRFLNRATLHRILKPLLKKETLQRAPGRRGRLKKRKIFADTLHVRF